MCNRGGQHLSGQQGLNLYWSPVRAFPLFRMGTVQCSNSKVRMFCQARNKILITFPELWNSYTIPRAGAWTLHSPPPPNKQLTVISLRFVIFITLNCIMFGWKIIYVFMSEKNVASQMKIIVSGALEMYKNIVKMLAVPLYFSSIGAHI